MSYYQYGGGGGGGAAGAGGGGGNADIGVLLRQAGEDDKGIFISHSQGDLSWHAQAEARKDAEAAIAASVTFNNEDNDASVEFTFPLEWRVRPEVVNETDIQYVKYPDPFAGVKASVVYGALRIQAAMVGAAGNDLSFIAEAGTKTVPAQNAKADIEGSRGVTPGHDGVIRVTSPDSSASGALSSAANDNNNNLVVSWHESGSDGDGFVVTYQVAPRDEDMATNAAPRIEATYAADNRSMQVVAHIGGGASVRTPYSAFADAINAARTTGGDQLITAVGTSTRIIFFSSRNITRTIDELPRMTLAGGVRAGGPGRATNFGEVRVVASGARTEGTAATYVWTISSGRQITLTFHQVGTSGNGLQFSTRQDTTLTANTVSVSDSGADFLVKYNGSVTLGALVDAMNAAGSRFSFAITQGSRADSVSITGNNSFRTSGGVDTVNPLSAVWDEDAHRLTVTALADDEFQDVRAAIVALDEFQLGDGTDAGDVQIEDMGRVDDTIDVPGTVGEHFSYAFAGGTDEVPRTPLTVTQNQGLLLIAGVVNTDTVQDVIDAYTAASKAFELAASSGNQVTSTLSGNAVAETQLTGGQDSATRQLPSWNLADNGLVTISLHANGSRNDNTTLFELTTAWSRATYTDKDGNTQTIGNRRHTYDLTGGGAPTDEVDQDNLPESPSGGRDEVLANLTEVEARPDDDFDGPNILIKYDPADTIQHLFDEFSVNNNGGFRFTIVYGTDPDANPEAVPFNRSFFDGGAEAPSTGTGGLTQSQVDARVRTLAKGYTLKGGPDVPESELPDDLARDDEIKDFALTGGPDVPEGDIDDAIARDDEIKAWAKVGGGNVPEGQIDDRIARDAEVDAIRHNLSLKDVRTVIGGADGGITIELNDTTQLSAGRDLKSVRYQGVYADGQTYKENDLVYHDVSGQGVGWFVANRENFSGIEPGVTNNWRNWWDFLGWRNGAPGSYVDVTFDSGNGELVATTRNRQTKRVQVPTGGTTVVANPSGTTGDNLGRLRIGGTDYNLPAIPDLGRTEQIALQDENNIATGAMVELDVAASNPISVVAGEGDARLLSGVTGNDFTVKAGLYLVSISAEARADGSNASVQYLVRQASDNAALAATSSSYLGRAADGWIQTDKTKLLSLASDTAINIAAHAIRAGADVRNVSVAFTEMFASARNTSTATVSPSISSYVRTSGDLTPVAGSIARVRYGVAWQIAQGGHMGAIRILGFKGAYGDGSGAVVVLDIGNGLVWASGSAEPIIPEGVSLAADETYTLRLQVFGEGVNNPGLQAAPVAYQDIVITAHAAAQATVRWGYLPYMAGDADAAASAARVDFSTDTTTGTALASEYAIDVPDGDTTTEYQVYLAVKSDQTQPSGFTSGGQPATASFYAAEDITRSSVMYKIYILKPVYRFTSSSNGQTFGVTS